MTTWLRGDDFPFKADSRSVCEYDKGKVWIAGAREGTILYYSVRQWKDGATVWSTPKGVSVNVPASTVQIFISEKDGYVQLQCGEQNWYIDPKKIDELTPVYPDPERTHMPAQVEIYAASLDYMLRKDSGYVVDGRNVDRDTFWLETFHRLHEIGIERIGIFPYAIEPGGIFNQFAPWMNTGDPYNGPWDLNAPNPLWWDETRRFLKLAASAGVLVVPVLIPGGYGNRPFQRNVQRVPDEWSEEARPFQARYIHDLVVMLKAIYAASVWKGEVWFRLSNEVLNHGDHDLGRRLARQHRFWYETVESIIPLERVVNDGSHSDWVYADLVERHQVFGEWMGDDRFGRRSWPEVHSISPWRLDQPVEEGREDTLWSLIDGGCNWRKWSLNTDGCDSGTGYQIPGTPFHGLSRAELGELCRRCWTATVEIRVAELPMEVLVRRPGDGFLVEDFTRIPFDRLSVMQEVFKSIT